MVNNTLRWSSCSFNVPNKTLQSTGNTLHRIVYVHVVHRMTNKERLYSTLQRNELFFMRFVKHTRCNKVSNYNEFKSTNKTAILNTVLLNEEDLRKLHAE
jgi:hypothetical protein